MSYQGRGNFNSDNRGRGRGRGAPAGRGGPQAGRGRGGGSFGGRAGSGSTQQEPIFTPEQYPRNIKSALSSPQIGTPKELIANFYKLIVVAEGSYYQYDFSAKVVSDDGHRGNNQREVHKRFMSKLFEKFREFYGDLLPEKTYFYDGNRNVFTHKELDLSILENATGTLVVPLSTGARGRVTEYELELKLAAVIDNQELLHFYRGMNQNLPEVFRMLFQVLVNSHMERIRDRIERSNDQVFYDLADRKPLKTCPTFEVVQGIESFVSFSEIGVTLNLGIKSSLMFANDLQLIRLLESVFNRQAIQPGKKLTSAQERVFNKVGRGVTFYTKHLGMERVYHFKRMVNLFPSEKFFPRRDAATGVETQCSVEAYFRECHNIVTRNLPLVETIRGEFVPLELAYLTPNQISRYDSKEISQDFKAASEIKPTTYFNTCQKVVEQLSQELAKTKDELGVALKTNPVKVMGHHLKLPTKKINNPSRASVAIFLSEDANMGADFVDQLKAGLVDVGKETNLALQITIVKKLTGENIANMETFINMIKVNVVKTKTDLVLFGMHSGRDHEGVYQRLKLWCNSKYGVKTQMFHIDKLYNEMKRRGVLRNLLTKVRGKIGIKSMMVDPTCLDGLNFDRKKTMIVGVDVIHPSEMLGTRSDLSKCSLSAVVGSTDPDFYFYSVDAMVQQFEGLETVSHIGAMFEKLLKNYHAKNKYYPESYIIFRDGVSKAQMFNAVREVELPQIKQAIYNVTGLTKAKVTVLVVPKRHTSRFMSLEYHGKNVPGGTAIFESVVEPKNKMFYLIAHDSPLGTSRPIKLYVIFDDHKFSTDAIYKLALYSCYNCVRSSNVVSVPVPIKYADSLAYHAKMLLQTNLEETGEEIPPEENLFEWLNNYLTISPELVNTMFFV